MIAKDRLPIEVLDYDDDDDDDDDEDDDEQDLFEGLGGGSGVNDGDIKIRLV